MPKINWMSFILGAVFVWLGLPLVTALLGRMRTQDA